jgi:hypothetical protein
MNPKKKLANRDRSVRHAFIYINKLKTYTGLSFIEISTLLNKDNYRTREGEKYTVERVSEIWNKYKGKYCSQPVYLERPETLLPFINQINKPELNAAVKELNVKLRINPPVPTNLSELKLIEALSKVILAYDINPKDFPDETLNVLGGLLFHPDFPKAKKL